MKRALVSVLLVASLVGLQAPSAGAQTKAAAGVEQSVDDSVPVNPPPSSEAPSDAASLSPGQPVTTVKVQDGGGQQSPDPGVTSPTPSEAPATTATVPEPAPTTAPVAPPATPTDPRTQPTTQGGTPGTAGPINSGALPTQPGALPTQPGALPTQPGALPAQPGALPTQPGEPPQGDAAPSRPAPGQAPAVAGSGSISGTVTADDNADPIGNIDVCANNADYSVYECVLTSAVDGTYTLAGLPSDDYLVAFSDSGGQYISEYFDDVTDSSAASLVSVTDPNATSGIDAGLAPGGSISGTVTAEDGGAPLAGVEVCAGGDNGGYGCDYTEADGTYTIATLPGENYIVSFTGSNAGFINEYFDDVLDYDSATPVSVTPRTTTPGVDAALGSGASVSGTVTEDGSGDPLENVYVCVFDQANVYECDYSGIDGTYDVGGLPSGNFTVGFSDFTGAHINEFFDDVTDFELATPVTTTVPNETANIDASLGLAGSISGTVIEDGTGDPLQDIYVCSEGVDNGAFNCTTTAADGTYTIGGLATGNYTVNFRDFDGIYVNEFFDDATDSDSATPVSVTAPNDTAGIDAGLATGGSISGTVTEDGSGDPLDGISVCAAGEDVNAYSCTGTAADGTYTVGGLPSGNFRVQFTDYSAIHLDEYFDDVVQYDAATLVGVTAPDATAGIDAGLSTGGSIAGTVTEDGSGDPLEDVQVCASGVNTDYSSCADTAADGTYSIGPLPDDSYRVDFQDFAGTYLREYFDDAANYDSATPVVIAAAADATGIDAGLSRGGSISGTVTEDGTGDPLEDISVCASEETGEDYGCTYTAPDGTYTIGGLATGSYRVSFDDDQDQYLDEYFDDATYETATLVGVTAPDVAPNIDAALTKGGSISGTVVGDVSGDPLEGIQVCAFNDAEGYFRCSSTETDGTYVISGLPSGDFVVNIYDPGQVYLGEFFDDEADYESATRVSVTAPNTTPNINAGLAVGGVITGTVTEDGSGDPLEYVQVCAGNDNTSLCAGTAPDGTYSISGLPTGDYTVAFYDYTGIHIDEYFDDVITADLATAVSVTAPNPTPNIDAGLAVGGVISGEVTEEASGDPLGDVGICAENDDGTVYRCSYTSDGSYEIGGLASGSYTVSFSSSDDRFLREYFDGVFDEESATPVAVTAPNTTPNIDASLKLGGLITGTVTDEVTHDPLEDIQVCAETDSSDFQQCGYTDSDGEYTIIPLVTGSHTVEFYDWSGTYGAEYFDDAINSIDATPVSVTAPNTTPNIDAEMGQGCSRYHDFTDVANGVFYECAVAWLVRSGITAGTSPGKYSPNATLTRGQMALFLYRVAGSPEVDDCSDNPFTDVPSGAFYECAVTWASDAGITGGVTATKFAPLAKVKRAQMVVFLYRLADSPPVDDCSDHPFTDVPANAYYECAMTWAVGEGITAGTSATKFSPANDVSRGQMAVFLWRFSGSPPPWSV
jgi:hypothetical protein